MTNRHFLQVVSPWITLAPSPKNEDGCSCVDRDAHRSIFLFWGNTSAIYAACAPGKFIQPAACGSDSGDESSSQDCNKPSPERGTEPHKESWHSPASATTGWMLWEVLRSGSSTPLTPHITKLSDLCWGGWNCGFSSEPWKAAGSAAVSAVSSCHTDPKGLKCIFMDELVPV